MPTRKPKPELAHSVEAAQDGQTLHRTDQRPDAVRPQGDAGRVRRSLAIERGWLELHRSGTFVRFTQAGADLFA
jgi:hypothetical protein